MINNESLQLMDKINAKLVILGELTKKFDYLRTLEKMCEADAFCLVSAHDDRIDILDEEFVEKIKAVLEELQKKTRQEIVELEQQYFSLLD